VNRHDKERKKKAKRSERASERRATVPVVRYPVYAPVGHPLRKGTFTADPPNKACESCGSPAFYAVTIKAGRTTDADFHFACSLCPDKIVRELRARGPVGSQ